MIIDSTQATDLAAEPLTAVVARALRQDILDGVMPPGTRITQDSIAAKYGTSRSPVREALRELAAEGLVTIVPDVGARVAPLDVEEVVEAYLMREALEPIAIARSAVRSTIENRARMRDALHRSDECARKGDMEGYLEADREFHQLSFAEAGMPRVVRAIHGLWNIIDRHHAMSSLVAARQDVGSVEHFLILDAFERHAGEDAAVLQQMHARRSRIFLSDPANAAQVQAEKTD
jgi:GntR family transcriptional regulator, rspAB operon transcriptional repressor